MGGIMERFMKSEAATLELQWHRIMDQGKGFSDALHGVEIASRLSV